MERVNIGQQIVEIFVQLQKMLLHFRDVLAKGVVLGGQ
jgi:hypothetical protein